MTSLETETRKILQEIEEHRRAMENLRVRLNALYEIGGHSRRPKDKNRIKASDAVALFKGAK